MFRAYDFNSPYQVIFTKREDWTDEGHPLALLSGDVWYTDGSKAGSRVVADVYGRKDNATIFQVEVKAILENAQASYDLRGRYISICSDSRAALAAAVKS